LFDKELAAERFQTISDACEAILQRAAKIRDVDELDEETVILLDAIGIQLVLIGEMLKRLDSESGSDLFRKHPEVDWRGFKGMRNIIVHQYDNIDYNVIHAAAKSEVPSLLAAVRSIHSELVSESNGV